MEAAREEPGRCCLSALRETFRKKKVLDSREWKNVALICAVHLMGTSFPGASDLHDVPAVDMNLNKLTPFVEEKMRPSS